MKATNLFNIYRFGLLLGQNLMHNSKLIALSLAGLFGGTFILLFLVQTANDFRPWNPEALFGSFLFLFIALGIICAGTAFPGLRTKERSYSFLLIPASTFEKFLMEYLSRVILFIIAMPVIFWVIYVIEGYVAEIFIPGYDFNILSLTQEKPFSTSSREIEVWTRILIPSVILLIFNIPFTGTTIFMKYPLLKTLFAVAVIFFFHVFLLFFFVQILDFQAYAHKNMSILFIKNEIDVLKFFTIYSVIINVALIAVSYLKLKEKEV